MIKERFLVLPNDTSISVDATGTWNLPVGGMMIKNFYYGSEIFETRFVVKTPAGVAPLAYSYRWDGNTATRVDDDVPNSHKELSNDPYLGYVDWEYPTGTQCRQCHKANANGFFLGLNTRQFNTEIEYASTGIRANQIATLQSLSILPQVMPSLTVPGFEPRPAVLSMSADQPETARAYLDVNCAYCHNDRFMSQWKAGYEYAFSDMGTCNVLSQHSIDSEYAPEGHDFIEPGRRDLSYISERAHDRGGFLQMPWLATNKVDHVGIASVDSWIDRMQSCAPPKKSIQMLDATTCLKAPVRTPPATAKNVDAVACSSTDPAQGFEVVDDGGGYVSLRPTLIDPNAPPGSTDCIMNVNTSLVRTSCVGTKHWYRDYLPGGSYQLVDAVTKECLTKFTYGARLEPCKGTSSQLWKNGNPPI